MLDAKHGGGKKRVAGKRKEVRLKRRCVEGNATRMQLAWCNTESSLPLLVQLAAFVTWSIGTEGYN
jgi:hypothetical protein